MAAVHTTKETTAVNLGDLLDDGDDAVVTLVAGETRLVAHRAVLMDRSPVFAAMFAHDTLEASSGQVDIEDVEGPVLRLLLTYLYTLRVPQLSGMAGHLLAAADKYGVAGLVAACEQQVAAQLSVETAAAAATLAVRHSCESLKKDAVNFIKANLQVMATQGWAEAVRLHSEDMVEVIRLLAEPPAESSPPAPADRGTPVCPSTQPHRRRRRRRRTPASAAPAIAASHHTPPPDDAVVSHLRSLPAKERNRRLIQAAEEGAVGELEALLAAGADVAAVEESGRKTALHWAAAEGHVEAARLLVARGAPVDARDYWEQTPLHWAAMYGHAAVVRLLLAASADHSARDSFTNGWTPLHWAAFSGHREAAAALLEEGANRGATDDEGRTALDVAREFNKQQLVELLAER